MNVFFRVSAAENTFILARDLAPDPKLAQKYCSLATGFTTDGFIFLNQINGVWRWDFFNRDGSSAEMCGNAARAVTLFLMYESNASPDADTVRFQTARGEVEGRVVGAEIFSFGKKINVEVKLPPMEMEMTQTPDGPLVQSGVPHLLRFQSEAAAVSLELLRKYNANITYLSKRTAHGYAAKTFERGVEAFTLACGTGAIAVARYDQDFDFEAGVSTRVTMPGGDLDVSFDGPRARLRGPAKLEFSFQEDF